MNRINIAFASLLFSLMHFSSAAFAGYLTVVIEGKSDSGPFSFKITEDDIQQNESFRIPTNVAGKSQSFHNTGVDVAFDIGNANDLFSVKPIWKFTVTGFKLTYFIFDLYVDDNLDDEIPGYENPIKVHYYDKNLFLADLNDPLKPRFSVIDPNNIENTDAMFIFQEVPEPSSLLILLLGIAILTFKSFSGKIHFFKRLSERPTVRPDDLFLRRS